MSVHTWSLIEVDDDESTIRTRSLSTTGVQLVQHVPNANANPQGIVTESINVAFYDYLTNDAQEISQEVNGYIEQAIRWSTEKKGPRIFLVFSSLGETETYRSPIVGGLIDWHPDALKAYASGVMEATIILSRLNYWEDTAETQIGSGNMTNNGSSRVALSNPGGAMPAPVRVELTNTTGNIAGRNFYLGINTYAAPGTIDLTLPGGTASWTAAQTHLLQYLTHSFTPTELNRLRGYRYYILVGLSAQAGEYYMRANLYFSSANVTLDRTHEVCVDEDEILVLGPIAIPSTGSGDGYGNMSLTLSVRGDAGSHNFTADWVQLMPAESYRHLYQTGFITESGDKWVDDGMSGQSYLTDTSLSYNIPAFESGGKPLEVMAGKASELLVVFDESTNGVDDSRTFSAVVKTRTRRRTL